MNSGMSQENKELNIVTAEINAYKQVVGDAVFEIGKRLMEVRDDPEKYGLKGYPDWENWCEEKVEMTRRTANKFIQAYTQFGATSRRIQVGTVFEMLTLPVDIDRQQFLEQNHEIPSTGEKKTVDEMTVRELRKVKKALKEAEAQRELALRDAQILRDTLESIEDKEPEIRTEYVEVTDESSEQKLRKYEELFGDVSMYEGNTTRVTNGDAITYTVFEFSEDVRKFVEKYGHLTHFAQEFNGMIGEGKDGYLSAINSIYSLLKSIERNLDSNEAVIINN